MGVDCPKFNFTARAYLSELLGWDNNRKTEQERDREI